MSHAGVGRRVAGLAVVPLVALAACAPIEDGSSGSEGAGATQGPAQAAEVSEVTSGGTLTMAATAPMVDWNPLSAAGDTTGQRQQQWPLYPHTFLTEPDTSVVLNEALLTSAEVVDDDPMTVEYVIREEARWSDGTPITAADFAYTQAVQDPQQCSGCMAAFTEGYSLIESVEGSEDGKTVTMVYEEPFAMWQALFNFILPAHVAEEYGDLETSFNEGFGQNVPEVSGGPYLVDDYTDGVSMTMVPNPQWYGEGPHLDAITVRYITGQGEQVTALQSGEVDLVYGIPTLDTMEQLRTMPGLTVQTGSTLTYYHLGLKTTGDIMSEAPLRRAIATALDLEDMRRRTVGQYAPDIELMRSSVYVPGQVDGGVEAYRDTMAEFGFGTGDVESALEILTVAGYQLEGTSLHGPDGEPVRDLTILTLGTDQLRMEVAQLVQQQLAAIGLTVVIDAADGSRYSEGLREGSFDIMATGTALDLGPLSLQQWYGTDAPRSFGYSSPEADRLLEESAGAVDPTRRVELMNELDRVLVGDAVVLPMFATPQVAAYRDHFANIFINPSKYGTTMNIQEWGSTE